MSRRNFSAYSGPWCGDGGGGGGGGWGGGRGGGYWRGGYSQRDQGYSRRHQDWSEPWGEEPPYQSGGSPHYHHPYQRRSPTFAQPPASQYHHNYTQGRRSPYDRRYEESYEEGRGYGYEPRGNQEGWDRRNDHSEDSSSHYDRAYYASPTEGPQNRNSRNEGDKILLVFDLDGVLVDRQRLSNAHPLIRQCHEHKVGNFLIKRRPHLDQLIDYLQGNRHRFEVMLWTSATQANGLAAVRECFPRDFFVAVWGREQCVQYYLTEEEAKVAREEAAATTGGGKDIAGIEYALTMKDLTSLWNSREPGFRGRWNRTNTILIDDDPKKASRHSGNAIHPASYEAALFASEKEYQSDAELVRLIGYLEGLFGDVQKIVLQCPYSAPTSLLKDK